MLGDKIQLFIAGEDVNGADAYTLVGNLMDFDHTMTREFVKKTTRSSPNRFDEFEPGYIDPGQITLPVLYDSTNTAHTNTSTAAAAAAGGAPAVNSHDGLLKGFLTGKLYAWKIQLDDDDFYSFKAYVAEAGIQAPYADNLLINLPLRVSGEVTFE